MSARIRAPREIERAMLTALNAELRARGATDVVDIRMSEEVRGEHCVLVVTPDIGAPFELLFPYVKAFPGMLAALPPGGSA